MTKKGTQRRTRMNASLTSSNRGSILDMIGSKSPKFSEAKKLSNSMTRLNPMQSSAIQIETPVVEVAPVPEIIDNLSGTQGGQDAADKVDPPAATDDNPPTATEDNPPAATEPEKKESEEP